MNIQNPSDLRKAFERLIEDDGTALVGGVRVTRDELQSATEELIWAMVDSYMNGGAPSPCITVLGRILLNELETILEE